MSRKKYRTILADPPRRYRNVKTGGSMKSGSAAKYPTMSLDELKRLPVHKIAARDSILFLWATTPLLDETFEIMKGWGFSFKTAIYWYKIKSWGLGFWFRGEVELCLLGIRGKIKAFRCQESNFIQSKARKHSQKPEEFYQLIEPVCLEPKIELFASERRKGWDALGFEIDGKDLKLSLEQFEIKHAKNENRMDGLHA